MYHAVTLENHEACGHVHVPYGAFAAQLQWLYENGYETITVSEIGDPRQSDAKKVVLTFDDGYYSLYHLVTPLLKRYRFSATLFLTTYPVGAANYDVLPALEKEFPEGDRPLTWQELEEMEHSCWDIQAHGHQHLVHNTLGLHALTAEIEKSKTVIERHLNKAVRFYAFPYGRYNHPCLRITRELGFVKVFTVQPALARFSSNRFRMPRIEVNRYVTMEQFAHKVCTGFGSRGEQLRWFVLQFVYRNVKWKDRIRAIYRKIRK